MDDGLRQVLHFLEALTIFMSFMIRFSRVAIVVCGLLLTIN